MTELLINFKEYFATEGVFDLGSSLIKILIILILAKFLLVFGSGLVDRLFAIGERQKVYIEERRANTLRTLIKNAIIYAIYFIIIVIILDEIGIPVAPLLAGAGIVSLAIGFGAQNLVRDIITGFFIIFEDQYSVSDYVKIGDSSGIVEEIGLRITKLRDWSGEVHVIPNGEITRVVNYSRGSMRALVEVGISYEEDVEKAIKVLNQVCQQINEEFSEDIVEESQVLGIVDFAESRLVIRIVARTKPLEQWKVERALRKKIKEVFDREGIEIPYPRRVLIKEGEPNEKI